MKACQAADLSANSENLIKSATIKHCSGLLHVSGIYIILYTFGGVFMQVCIVSAFSQDLIDHV